MKQKIIAQGAEAILYKKGKTLTKDRIMKGYRLLELDEKLRKQRTRKEAKLLEKAGKIINSPQLIKLNEKEKIIQMEFIKGKKLSESLDGLRNAVEICRKIGENIAKLHDSGIIHGDLTTSNMILKEESVYFIDFGLGFESHNAEDKAVDLHLIKQALEAKHFKYFDRYFDAVLQGYKVSKGWNEVMKRFEKVEKRGRYKQAY
ncbi:MAG: KEOPS complex kinase/ATPase Bud32 [Nanoarchaeota archaeon]|nr:KEOPS complex kinase/ATPase Bud32 [Nanoarchaeota archaeon]